MFQSLFRNIPYVTKNLIIINALFFLATFVLGNQGIDIDAYLSIKYFDSPLFQPYQFVTHFFMHGSFSHLLFNMIGILFLGGMLENAIGPKRFLIFYFATALIGVFFEQIIDAAMAYNYAGTFFPFSDGLLDADGDSIWTTSLTEEKFYGLISYVGGTSRGASGAIYAILGAVAYLFPNQTVHLYFFIPVKLKWIAIGFGIVSLYGAFIGDRVEVDGHFIGHLAHLTGLISGLLLIILWQKNRSNFY